VILRRWAIFMIVIFNKREKNNTYLEDKRDMTSQPSV
jgi:hypothetical protein